MTKKMLFMIMLLSAMGTQAQEIVKCSAGKTFWLIKDNGKNYAVKLNGNVKESNHPRVIVANGKTLQYLIVDKKPHAEKGGSDDDLKVLSTFVGDETTHIVSQFKAHVNIKMELVELSNGRKAIYWNYQMPEGISNEVEMQHFLNVVEGDKIFGLASPQFKGDDSEEIRQMLIDTLKSLNVVKDSKSLCK